MRVHRRSASTPTTDTGLLAAVMRLAGNRAEPESVPAGLHALDVGFATAVPTDEDSADDELAAPRPGPHSPSPLPLHPPARLPLASSPLAPATFLRRRPRRASAASISSTTSYHADRTPLDYLDLAPSLPLALAGVRDSVLAHVSALEACLPRWAEPEKLQAHLAAARDQLRIVLARVPREGMVTRMADVSAEVGTRLISLKAHLDAATVAAGGEWTSEMDALRARTARTTKALELRLGEWSAGAWGAVSRAKDQAEGLAENLEQRLYHAALDLAAEGRRLITYADLPELWRNNEYILTGYRFIPMKRWPRLIRSTVEWHNETLNVWLHLIGIALVLAAPWLFPAAAASGVPGSETTAMDKIMSWVYIGAAIECMAFSVTWHVMAGCADIEYFTLFACVDYTGIAWLIAASEWTMVYNLFYWQANIIWAYVAVTGILAIVCTILPFVPAFNANKSYRIAVFLALSAFGLLPTVHAACAHGVHKTLAHLLPMAPSLLAYLGGLVFYATNFPESWYPGRFDFIGHAHQAWHASIVLAVLLHYRCVQGWHASRAVYADPNMPLATATNMDPTSPWGGYLSPTGGGAVGPVGTAATLLAAEAARLLPVSVPAYKDDQALLTAADAAVYGFKVHLGAIGGGAVGRMYNSIVEWVSARLV